MYTTTDQTLEKQNKKLSVLYEIALTVGRSLDLRLILDDVLGRIIAFMGVDAGVIYVINDETLEMIPVTYRNLSEAVVRDLSERRVKVGECMCGNIAQYNSEVIIFERASSDPRFTRAILKKEGMEFYAGLPITAKGKVVGVICVITHSPYFPDKENLDILRAATVPIGLAIENAVLFESARKEAEINMRYYNFDGIIANSPQMIEVLNLVRKVTDTPSSILIYGESGTGKELIARAIHFNSIRKETPFIAVNCAAIPDSLLESELFGYVKGAFTGANNDKRGLFEAADGGTIFLDEVEAMSKNLQAKLLRVLQDRTFFKVGSTKPVTVDLRIIAASNQDLDAAVKTKQFRQDLFYRLNVIKITLPPLRERVDDIPLLARYFINKFNKTMGRNIRRLSDDAMNILLSYRWPGNIRELENSIERAVVVAETDAIMREDLPVEITSSTGESAGDLSLENIEKSVELEHIKKVLNIAGGNKKKAAEILGIDASTLWRKMKRYDKNF
ncbi:MAG: sigma 54-interacting transcriptional regulator [Nitrospirota bacterium]